MESNSAVVAVLCWRRKNHDYGMDNANFFILIFKTISFCLKRFLKNVQFDVRPEVYIKLILVEYRNFFIFPGKLKNF